MKKTLKYIFTMLLMVLSSFAFVACGDTPPEDPSSPPDSPPSGTQYGIWVDDSQSQIVTVTLSKTQAYAGETITIAYTVEQGYKVKWFDIGRSWQDEWGAWQNEVIDSVMGSFVMPEHNVTIWVILEEDVPEAVMEFAYDMPSDSYAVTSFGSAFEQIVPPTYDDGVHGVKPVTIIRGSMMGHRVEGAGIVRLPNTITTIEYGALSMMGLKSVNIPSSVTSFEDYYLNASEIINHSSFNITPLEGVEVTESHLYKTSDNSAYFIVGDTTNLVYIKAQENMVYPSSGITLKNYDNSSKTTTLASYNIPRNYVVENKDIIKTITLGQGTIVVEELGYGPFLSNITFNEGLVTLLADINFCKIESLDFPNSLEYWCGMSNNSKIKNINIGAASKLKAIMSGEFKNNPNIALNEYQGAQYLPSENNDYFMLVKVNDYSTLSLNIHPACKVISSVSVWGDPNMGISELNIPASVRGISDGFLMYMYALEKINIAEGSCLEHIEYYINDNYNSILFPATVTKLSGTVPEICYFQSASVELNVQEDTYKQLKMFFDVDRVVETEDYTYVLSHANKAYLTWWNPDNVARDLTTIENHPIVYIGEKVFKDNGNVGTITLSNEIKYIGREAFYGCGNVQLINFDYPHIEYIGENAFYGCHSIRSVYIPAGCKVGLRSLPASVIVVEDDYNTFTTANNIEYVDDIFTNSSLGNIKKIYFNASKTSDYIYAKDYSQSNSYKMALIKYIGSSQNVTPPTTIGGENVAIIAPFCYADSILKTFDSISQELVIESAAFYGSILLQSIKVDTLSGTMFTIPSNTGAGRTQTIRDLTYLEVNKCSAIVSDALPQGYTLVIHEDGSWLVGHAPSTLVIPKLEKHLGALFMDTNPGSNPLNEMQLNDQHQRFVPTCLKKLTITGGTSIGNYYIKNCTNLEEIILGSSIAIIGTEAIAQCTKLQSVSMPGVASINTYAFYNCTALKSVVFDYPLTSITSGAFLNCKLENITYSLANPSANISNLINDINDSKMIYHRIVNTPNLDMSKLPNHTVTFYVVDDSVESVTNIARKRLAFEGSAPSGYRDAMTEYLAESDYADKVDLYIYENSVGIIENADFRYLQYDGNKAYIIKALNNSVTFVSISGLDVKIIGDKAFMDSGVTSITMPNTITYIGWQAFENCTNLTSVTLSNTLVEMDYRAFHNCTKLSSITLPASLLKMGNYIFEGCLALSNVNMSNTTLTYISMNAFSGCKALTNFVLPSQITHIDDYAFYNTGITSFTGLDTGNVEYIGEYAFTTLKSTTGYISYASYSAIPFTTLNFNSAIKTIEEGAFAGCKTLTTLTFASGIETLGAGAFYGAAITALELPDSATNIGGDVFGGNQYLVSYKGPIDTYGRLNFLAYDSTYQGHYLNALTDIEITSGTTIAAGCFKMFDHIESLVIGEALWDWFYAGEYYNVWDDDLDFVSIPCLMGRVEELSSGSDVFSGVLKLTGKAGYTGFPIGVDSLNHSYLAGSVTIFVTFEALDLTECKFTEANVQTGGRVRNHIMMPTTLTRITSQIILDGNILLYAPITECYDFSDSDVSVDYVISAATEITEEEWAKISITHSHSSTYYVFTKTQFDVLNSKHVFVELYYNDGDTRENNIIYWNYSQYNYPAIVQEI